MSRIFDDNAAKREMTPLWVGLAGPSGCGKTYSALRIAKGIQSVTGGEIFGIDTEARRMLHYAEDFQFRHVQFGPPFKSLDYLEAVRHCASKGARIIVVDSLSHEHDGSGGYLEFHAQEEERMRNNPAARFAAWQVPSKQRNDLIQGLLQLPISFVFCFRAKEKLKPGREKNQSGQEKSVMRELGWMPIGGQAFIYEMTVCCLLPPGSNGVPCWKVEEFSPEQKLWVKKPKQFLSLLKDGVQLSEEIGIGLALWANGGTAPPDGWHEQQSKAVSAALSGVESAKPLTGPDASFPCPVCAGTAPNCRECKCIMLWRPSGVQRGTSQVYPAFWACPNHCKDSRDKRRTTNMKADEWHSILSNQLNPPKENPDAEPSRNLFA